MVKNSLAKAGDFYLIPWSGRSPGEANGNPLQCFSLGYSRVRGPDGQQSMGLQESRHDRVTKQQHNYHLILIVILSSRSCFLIFYN